MRVLPHKGPRSRARSKRSTGRSARDPKMCEVEPPKIFVRVPDGRWTTHKYTAAKIRVRCGCYRYLVWREGMFKREFYLGKVKNLALQISRGARDRSAAGASFEDLRAGVQK